MPIADTNGDFKPDSYANGYGHIYAYPNGNAYGPAKALTDATASADTAAAPEPIAF